MANGRTLEEMLTDAETAMRHAKGQLAMSLDQKEKAKKLAAEWRVRLDELEERIGTLKVCIGSRGVPAPSESQAAEAEPVAG